MKPPKRHNPIWYVMSVFSVIILSIYVIAMEVMIREVGQSPLGFLVKWGEPFFALCCGLPVALLVVGLIFSHSVAVYREITTKAARSYLRLIASLVILAINLTLFAGLIQKSLELFRK